MADLGSILNKIDCGSSGALGTGTKWCDFNPYLITGLKIYAKGTRFNLGEEYSLEAFETLQIAGKATILKNAKNFEDNSAENTKQTYAATGSMSLVRLGLYEFTMTFEAGVGFYKSLRSLDSNGDYDVTFVDINGNELICVKNGVGKGFSTNYLAANLTKFNTGSENTSKSISFQLADTLELDSYAEVIKKDDALYDTSDVDGANELVYSWNTDPEDTDTTIIIDVKSMVNSNIDVAAILDTLTDSIVANVNGTDVVPTVVARTAKGQITATITALAANDEVFVYAPTFKIDGAGIFQAKPSKTKVVA